MRTLDKWSANSFRKTAPRPVQGEPSRRIAVLLEIARVDRIEAQAQQVEALEARAAGDQRGGELGPHVAGAEQPERARALDADAADARHALDQALDLGAV